MASFAPIKGTRTQIGNTAIVEGQFLVETDQNQDNRIYLDKGTGAGQRIIVGGNSNYIDLTSNIIAGTGASETVTFTNAIITASDGYQIFSEEFIDAGSGNYVPKEGTSSDLLTPLSYTGMYTDESTNTASVVIPSVPNGRYFKVTLRVFIA